MAPMSFVKGSKNEDGVLAQLAVNCDEVLTTAGVHRQIVSRAVVELMNSLRQHFGGWTIYIPKGRVTKDDRAAEVYARYKDGESIVELAESYGFVPMYISQLIAHEGRRLREIRQKAEASARQQRAEKHHG